MMCAIQSVFSIHLENTLCGHTKKSVFVFLLDFSQMSNRKTSKERGLIWSFTQSDKTKWDPVL